MPEMSFLHCAAAFYASAFVNGDADKRKERAHEVDPMGRGRVIMTSLCIYPTPRIVFNDTANMREEK